MKLIQYSVLMGLFMYLYIANAQAQTDPQFSQFYNVPLYHNPASVGTAGTRFALTSRAQWAEVESGMNTTLVALDHSFDKSGSNVGGFILRDQQGKVGVMTYHVALQYGYAIKLSKTWRLRAAMELGVVNKRLENNLKFVDQFDNSGLIAPTSSENLISESIFYPSIGTGLLLHNDTFWAGAAINHLNRPEQSFFAQNQLNTRVATRTTIYAGARIPLFHDINSSLSPTFLYKQQGSFKQMDLGVYTRFPISYAFKYKHKAASSVQGMAGLVYRGWVFEKYEHELPNNDAIIVMAGLGFNNWGISYSFDAGINGRDVRLNNAHEISLVYTWKKSKKRRKTFFPCPSF